MSDINSGLPIRSQLPGQVNYNDIIVKIGDGTTPSQLLAVDSAGLLGSKLFDGAGTAITSQASGGQQALDVGINVAGVQIDPRSIRALTNADVVTVEQGTSPWVVSGTVTSEQGTSPWVVSGTVTAEQGTDPWVIDGTVQSAQDGTWTVGLSEDHDYGAVGATTLRTAAQLGNATGAAAFGNGATNAQTLRVAANLAVGGADVSVTNPVPVVISADNAGAELNDFNTAAAVASGATSNHDYEVPAATTLLLTQIEAAATGKMKIEVQIEDGVASDSFDTKFVQFNSTASPNMTITLKSPISVAAGVRVRIIRTNKDGLAQDVYSTICGQEIS